MPDKKHVKKTAKTEKPKAKALEKRQEKAPKVKKEIIPQFIADIPRKISEDAEKFCVENKIDGKTLEMFKNTAVEEYKRNMVEYGEAVGIIAAQSLGEPGTQLTLRTKHYAGAAEVSVGSGIQRVEELVDGRSRTKYPVMTIRLSEDIRKDKELAEEFARSLVDVRGEDIVRLKENLDEKVVTLEGMEEIILEKNLKTSEIMQKIKEQIKSGDTVLRGNRITITFPKNASLLKVRNETVKVLKKRVQGVSGLKKTIVLPENDGYIIKTSGTNLKAILRKREVNSAETTTNDIMEISKILGIEAGRRALIDELHMTLKNNGINVDIRHIMLLGDLISFNGTIMGTVRTGIMREKGSPFARAAFEETVKHLLNAAFNGEKEELKGVVENIIVGQPIRLGTGVVELVMKEAVKK